jgi:hypothetical protein
LSIHLFKGDSVSGTISVSGGSGNDINFRATDPNGNDLAYQDRTTYTSFSFTASISGTYTLTFDNSFSLLSSKSVSLSYSVQSPTPEPLLGGDSPAGGLNILLIAGLAVVAFIVVILVIVIVLARKHAINMRTPSPP